MLGQVLIEPSKSGWASNVVMVKKDGTLRFCVDYRKLNSVTVKDVYPLPRIDACSDTLAGSQWFSTFDLRAGYHQVKLHPRDAHKTTFLTRRGSFQFRVLPFGLCNARHIRTADGTLRSAGWTMKYCWYTWTTSSCFSSDLEEHFRRMELLFQRLAAGLKLNPSKCHLLQREVLFLGHRVNAQGISTDADKINLVDKWPVPRNLKELRRSSASAPTTGSTYATSPGLQNPFTRWLEKKEGTSWPKSVTKPSSNCSGICTKHRRWRYRPAAIYSSWTRTRPRQDWELFYPRW